MTDEMIEAVKRAFYPELMLSIDDPAWQKAMREAAQDAIRAAAPLILDMAADVVESGMYNEYGRPQPSLVNAIRQLKERFQ